MKKIYIAGPMTGLENLNYPAFNKAAERLRGLGYHVENPAQNIPPACGSWEGYLKLGIRQMLTCDTVALLPGWDKSKGAQLEVTVAERVGITVVDEADIVTPIFLNKYPEGATHYAIAPDGEFIFYRIGDKNLIWLSYAKHWQPPGSIPYALHSIHYHR